MTALDVDTAEACRWFEEGLSFENTHHRLNEASTARSFSKPALRRILKDHGVEPHLCACGCGGRCSSFDARFITGHARGAAQRAASSPETTAKHKNAKSRKAAARREHEDASLVEAPPGTRCTWRSIWRGAGGSFDEGSGSGATGGVLNSTALVPMCGAEVKWLPESDKGEPRCEIHRQGDYSPAASRRALTTVRCARCPDWHVEVEACDAAERFRHHREHECLADPPPR